MDTFVICNHAFVNAARGCKGCVHSKPHISINIDGIMCINEGHCDPEDESPPISVKCIEVERYNE